MKYHVTIEIPGLPRMSNGSHGSWQAKLSQSRQWQKWVGLALMAHPYPPKPLQKIRATFTRFSSSEPDFDGLVHGMKSIRDALVKCGIVVDDAPKHFEGVYLWQKAKPKEGKIRIEIEEIFGYEHFWEIAKR